MASLSLNVPTDYRQESLDFRNFLVLTTHVNDHDAILIETHAIHHLAVIWKILQKGYKENLE